MKVKFNKPTGIDIETDINVEVFIDSFSISKPTGIRIIILEEPKRTELFDLVQKHQDCYTHVLTYQDEILRTNPKAILFHCPNTWIKDYTFPEKEFSVSTIVGGKNDPVMNGYALRHELWKKQDKITIPKKFYLSGNAAHFHRFVKWNEADYTGQLVLDAAKEPLFNSMFHIAIENTSIKNYFSEKIIDCFQTLTVPIYWGCTNIQDLIYISNILTPKKYYSMLPALKENLKRSNEWTDSSEKMKQAIIDLI
jgi:hypothetical protein